MTKSKQDIILEKIREICDHGTYEGEKYLNDQMLAKLKGLIEDLDISIVESKQLPKAWQVEICKNKNKEDTSENNMSEVEQFLKYGAITVEDAAKILKCSSQTILGMILNGKMRAMKLGRTYRLRLEDVNSMFQFRVENQDGEEQTSKSNSERS